MSNKVKYMGKEYKSTRQLAKDINISYPALQYRLKTASLSKAILASNKPSLSRKKNCLLTSERITLIANKLKNGEELTADTIANLTGVNRMNITPFLQIVSARAKIVISKKPMPTNKKISIYFMKKETL